MVKKFQKRKEDFICEECGVAVRGDGYTDHCPECLYGKHVDIFPGDRFEDCHGLLVPVGVEAKGNSYVIRYVCEKCGEKMTNRAAKNDSSDALIALAQSVSDKIHKAG